MNYKGLLQTFDRSCYLTNTTQTDIVTSTFTTLDWDTEVYDTDTFHDAVNPSRITISKAGKYLFVATARWAEVVTGAGLIDIQINGSTKARSQKDMTAAGTQNVTLLFDMANGDYAEARVWHNHGANRNVHQTYTFFQTHMMPPENSI